MRALSLFGVLVVARVLVLFGRDADLSFWTPFAYLWQDVVVALVFATLDRFWGKRTGWVVYAALVVYAAINVPVTRILSSPLTWTMIRAAGAPLQDSIALYLSPTNIALILLVIAAGIGFPLLSQRFTLRLTNPAFAAATAVILLGMFSTSKVATLGMHRNAIGALWPARIPVSNVMASDTDPRISPYPARSSEDLSAFRGAASGRNIVLIILESTAARYLKPYGAAEDPMPNLTELARESVVFDSAYAVYPESIKGLFSTLCSRYPGFATDAEKYADVPCASVVRQFADAGYRTGLFHSGRFMYLGMEAVIENRGFDTLEDAGAIGGNVNSSFGVDEPATVQRMLSWIDSVPKGQPFFLAYLPVAGHHPYISPGGPFDENTEFGRYLNALHAGDAALGEFLRGLRSRDLDRNTLYVVFGDHGEAFGQHSGNYGHTLFIHDENVRVPYLIAAPGVVKQQIHIGRLASLIDTAPTLLDLAGLPISSSFQGSSLLEPQARMALFFTDYSLGWLGLRDGCLKYTYETAADWSRLYDVCGDPEEVRDLSKSDPERIAQYREIVSRWIQPRSGGTLPAPGFSRGNPTFMPTKAP